MSPTSGNTGSKGKSIYIEFTCDWKELQAQSCLSMISLISLSAANNWVPVATEQCYRLMSQPSVQVFNIVSEKSGIFGSFHGWWIQIIVWYPWASAANAVEKKSIRGVNESLNKFGAFCWEQIWICIKTVFWQLRMAQNDQITHISTSQRWNGETVSNSCPLKYAAVIKQQQSFGSVPLTAWWMWVIISSV